MISVSIVLYNHSFDEIVHLIQSLSDDKNIGIIYLIDNSSSKELTKIPKKISPKIEYIYGQGNIGFGAGHNIGIRRSIAKGFKYHLILNPDILIEAGTFSPLLTFMESHTEIGLVMPKIIYPNGKTQNLCKLLATPIDLIGRRFIPFQKWNEKRNIRYELKFTNYDQIMQVPSLSGCFMLIRTNILEKVNGFDERFFLYCEDLDLCRRIGEISQTVFYPEVSVIHNYEKGSYKSNKLLLLHIVSAIKYFNKWGWFFDRKRRLINSQTLTKLGYDDHLGKNHSS